MKTSEYYQLSFDKFNLKVPKGYWFAGYDTWAKVEDNHARVGITDFLQTKMGDIAFFTPSDSELLEQDDGKHQSHRRLDHASGRQSHTF